MGNTIKTELDLVLEESSENIDTLKNSATMKPIITHAQKEIETSWKPEHERQEQAILAVQTSQSTLETTLRNHSILHQQFTELPTHDDIKALEDRINNL